MIDHVQHRPRLPASLFLSHAIVAGVAVVCWLAGAAVPGVANAQEKFLIVEETRTTGQIKSVAAGLIEVTAADGQDLKFKIQEKNQDGVAMTGTATQLRFPAHVSLSGALSLEALTAGTLVRFTAKVNRQGRTEGSVSEILVFDEKRYPLGVKVDDAGPAGGYATCTIGGEVVAVKNGRLQVDIPKSDFVRTPRLAVSVASDAKITLETDDYRRAQPGDQVQLLAARFASGDRVIKELTVTLAPRSKSRSKPAATEAGKYRQLSDAPSTPRDVRSAHFVLHTDISDRAAKMLLDKLEYMLAIVAQYYARPPTAPIEAYVVRDIQQWPEGLFPPSARAKILEPAGVTLSVTSGGTGRSVVYSCDAVGVVQHECVHAYCTQTFGGTGPTWYSEGMAEMGHYWKKDQLAVDLDPAALAFLKRGPAKQMLDIVAAGQITGDSWQNYCWRWALCYMLAMNPNYSGQFRALGIALMSKQPGASFEATYGPVARQISFEYDLFCQQVDNGYRVDLCAWPWNRKSQYLHGDGNVSCRVAAKYGWQASGIKLKAGQSYDYAAKGTWKVTVDGAACDANGQADGTGRLVGCVFQDFRLGAPFELGTKGTLVASQDGDLMLRCRDDWNKLANHDGNLTVYFRRTPAQ